MHIYIYIIAVPAWRCTRRLYPYVIAAACYTCAVSVCVCVYIYIHIHVLYVIRCTYTSHFEARGLNRFSPRRERLVNVHLGVHTSAAAPTSDTRKSESIHHHHHPEGVLHRDFCLNSGTVAVSTITSRRWSCIESVFPDTQKGITGRCLRDTGRMTQTVCGSNLRNQHGA